MPINKEALLAGRHVTRTVEIPGVGEVEVRGLTRGEAIELQELGQKDMVEAEIRLISLAFVDPKLTEDEARQWYQSAPAGELLPISDAIQEMSGLKPAALKEEITQFRG
jgi:hypothetical protein